MPEQVLIPCGGSFERGATDAASAEDVATAADNHTMPCFGLALRKLSKKACNSKSCENWTRPWKILIPMCPNKLLDNHVVSLGGMVHLNQIWDFFEPFVCVLLVGVFFSPVGALVVI